MEKTVAITGASRGLGAAVARAFGAEGAHLVLCARDTESLDHVAADVLEAGGSVTTVRADVRDEFDVERFCETAARESDGGIDVLVANAGVNHGAPGEMPLGGEPYSRFDDTLRTNVRGVFATVREAVPYLTDDARILVPSGSIARDAKPRMGAYAVSKAGAEAVVRQAHADLDATAMTLDLGLIDTALTGNQGGRDPEDVAPMFVWAATDAEPDEHGGAVLGLREWKTATR